MTNGGVSGRPLTGAGCGLTGCMMQLLRTTKVSPDPVRDCAREVLETVPLVMRFIRDQVRRDRTTALSLPQFRTLAFLSGVSQASLSEGAEHLGLSLPAMSRLVNALVAERFVGRRIVATNRRQIALTLTARGRAILEQARGEVRKELAAALEHLPAGEQKAVLVAMQVLHRIFDFQPAPGTPRLRRAAA